MSTDTHSLPRIGVPYRTAKEELNGDDAKYEKYMIALREADTEPVPVSLRLSPEELSALMRTLDAFALTGSPADVDPALYRAARHPRTEDADSLREKTDCALLKHAFAEEKPVLAICYGIQSLNVFLGGTLVQHISTGDVSSEVKTAIPHWLREQPKEKEFRHPLRIEAGSRLARLAGAAEAGVNSSHHQSIREPGSGLRVTARAEDGVIEAVEWTRGPQWVTGVQWHPERMAGDALARALFRELAAVARGVKVDG
jgi:putative glutamine amidotransferase